MVQEWRNRGTGWPGYAPPCCCSAGVAVLAAALERLQAALPDVVRVTLPDVGDTASLNDGRPELVAAELRRFFA
ncbi:hypothetical protein [Nocardia altamirensis]|uniref:hypothetical protein n=1 Tax=Nocardia altamirensis TaxID=472158 RepID=UPI00114CBF57|nr:hypothetical protein [Nocardia altamirensis]